MNHSLHSSYFDWAAWCPAAESTGGGFNSQLTMVFCCKLPRKSFVIFTIVSIRKFAKQVTRKNANFLWQRFGCQKTFVSKIPYRNECDTTCHSAENFQNRPWPSPFSNKRYETFCDRFHTHSFKYIRLCLRCLNWNMHKFLAICW